MDRKQKAILSLKISNQILNYIEEYHTYTTQDEIDGSVQALALNIIDKITREE